MVFTQGVTQSKFPKIVFNISGENALIGTVSEDAQIDSRCKFWDRT